MFSQKEKNELRGDADGHVLAISEYAPNSEYIYYFGSAWSKAAIQTINQWNQYVEDFTQEIRNPLATYSIAFNIFRRSCMSFSISSKSSSVALFFTKPLAVDLALR